MATDHTHIEDGVKLAAAAAAVIVGGMVLAGWAFDIAVPKSVLPGWVSMKANTAACFVLIGVALWLTARPPATLNQKRSILFSRLARLCSLLAGLIGLLTLGEYVFGWELGIDQGLFRASEDIVGTSHPGRMAPETALNFVLLSVALWFVNGTRKTRRTILAAVNLGLLVAIFALSALLSYLTPGLGAYGWFGFTLMALPTAILFALLGMAVIAISWQPDILQWSFNRHTTAAFACGLVMLAFIGLSASRSQLYLNETNRQIVHSEQVMSDIFELLIEVIDAQANARGYVISGDERVKDQYLKSKINSNLKLDALRKLMAGSPHRQQQLAQIEMRANAMLQWLQQTVDIERTGITDAARSKRIAHGEALMDSLHNTLDQIASEYRQLNQQLEREAEGVDVLFYRIIFFSTLVSLMIFLIVMFRLNSTINERKQADASLRNSEFQLQTVIENLTEGLVVSGLDGQVLHFNHAALGLHGYTTLDECRQHLNKFAETFELSALDGAALPVDQWPLARVLRGENLRNLELYVRHLQAGWRRIFNYGGTLVCDDDGQPLLAILTISDITERKQAEAEIHQLNAELEQRVVARTAQLQAANTDLEGFSYSVSHDLRVPLRAIDGFSKLVLKRYEDKLDDEGKRLLNVVRDNTKRMGHLIDDILAFSRAGRLEIRASEADMEALSRDVWQELEPSMAGRDVRLDIKPLPKVQGDPAMLRQMWVNLLGNAAKYTNTRATARIEVGASVAGGECVFYVKDNGVGFDQQYVEKLFGVFQRLHGVDEFEGTGIGLAIVKRIITRHGGRVWAEGKVNEGATFYFALPAILTKEQS